MLIWAGIGKLVVVSNCTLLVDVTVVLLQKKKRKKENRLRFQLQVF